MKSFIILLLIFIFNWSVLFAQAAYKIKEQYDILQPLVKSDVSYEDGFVITSIGNLGDGMSRVIASYLTMYETTGDKAYLIKFIQECIKIQKFRNDITHPSWSPKWSIFDSNNQTEELYHNGIILMPMAKYVYIVKSNTSLYNTTLYQTSELQFSSSHGPFNITFQSYGSFADWLSNRIYETLAFMINNYWGSEGVESFNHETDIINKQSDIAAAFMYLGLANYDNSYLSKSATIANMYHSTVMFNDICPSLSLYSNQVLRVNNSNNSYWWFVHGWNIPTRPCWSWINGVPMEYQDVPDIDRYSRYEDISHGFQSLVFPIEASRTQGNSYFDQDEMIKFHNTFTKNIFFSDHFHNNVYGTESFVANNIQYIDFSFDHFQFMALNYMPLHKFDYLPTNSHGSIYDIVMKFYRYHVYNKNISEMANDKNESSAAMINGLSEVVKAQWERESCVNLTLYNRDVVYDQNFSVANRLFVFPNVDDSLYTPGDASFAEPIINANKFVIRSGVHCVMTAGDIISLEDGFEAEMGSEFEAVTTGDPCPQFRVADQDSEGENTGGDATKRELKSTQTNAVLSKNNLPFSFNLYPVPAKSEEHFSFSIPEKSEVSINITNLFGENISIPLSKEMKEAGTYETVFDTNMLAPGVYFCNFISGYYTQTRRIIILR